MADLITRIEAEIPALRRYATALVRDPAGAEDLVQDCLERALARRHLWRRPGHLRAWLFTLMRRIHSNQARALYRRPTAVALDEERATSVARDDPASRAELEQVLTAIDALPAEQREVLILVAVEGLRYREAATVLGVAAGTIMSRLARARERLRMLRAGDREQRLRRVK